MLFSNGWFFLLKPSYSLEFPLGPVLPGDMSWQMAKFSFESCILQRTNLAVHLRLNEGPCILQRTNLAVNLRLNWGSSILQRTNLAVNLRLNDCDSHLVTCLLTLLQLTRNVLLNWNMDNFKFNFLSRGQLESLNLDRIFLPLFEILPC